MKIGFALFCTGKYRMFLDGYIKTCEEKFLKNSHKKYFIFTDEEVVLDEGIDYQWIPLQKMGWPYDTLRRYAMINKHKEVFNDMDYLLSTNVNMIFNEEVTEEELLPTEQDNWMASVHHPNWFDKEDATQFPYERNPISTAYVAPEESGRYLQACFIVGRREEFLKMSQYVEEQSELDIANHNFIAIYWDESYINKYWLSNPPRILSPSYAYPELYNIDAPKKVLQIEKGLHGGHSYLRS